MDAFIARFDEASCLFYGLQCVLFLLDVLLGGVPPFPLFSPSNWKRCADPTCEFPRGSFRWRLRSDIYAENREERVLFGDELEERGRDFVLGDVVMVGDVLAKDFFNRSECAARIGTLFVESEVLLLLGLRDKPLFAGGALDFGGLGDEGGRGMSREKLGERRLLVEGTELNPMSFLLATSTSVACRRGKFLSFDSLREREGRARIRWKGAARVIAVLRSSST